MQLNPIISANARKRAVISALLLLLSLCNLPRALADGELALRGAYYKEDSTRVIQPMLDARFDIGEDTELSGHLLVDAITSASAAAGAADTAFTEQRYETGATLTRRFRQYYQCSASGRFSTEPDYRSLFAGGRCQVDLAERNTTLATALSAGRDRIDNSGAQDPMSQGPPVDGRLTSLLISGSISQILSPTMLATLTYDFMLLRGFLENPYRRVPIADNGTGMLVPENVPNRRYRHAVFASVRGFIPMSATTWLASTRLYRDDWGLLGITPEARLIQEILPDLEVHTRYRYHRQNAADFYQDTYAGMQTYLTTDAKLSEFTTHTLGIKLDSALRHLGIRGPVGDARIDVVLEYIVQNNRFGNALVVQSALTVPLNY